MSFIKMDLLMTAYKSSGKGSVCASCTLSGQNHDMVALLWMVCSRVFSMALLQMSYSLPVSGGVHLVSWSD